MTQVRVAPRLIPSDKAKCKGPNCGAEIAFVMLQPRGQLHAIDFEPVDEGSIGLTEASRIERFEEQNPRSKGKRIRPVAVMLSRAARDSWPGPRYRSHAESCPNATSFRPSP